MRKIKNAFTIVELVIVIAVIAILAAILIPTFSNIINSANETKDISLTKNLNSFLALEENLSGKSKNIASALNVCKISGIDTNEIKTKSNCDLVWNKDTNRFLLIRNQEVIFGDGEIKASYQNLWEVAFTQNDISKNNYGHYFYNQEYLGELKVSSSLYLPDTSKVTKVIYENNVIKKEVELYTFGCDLTINAPSDTIHHYGKVNNLFIDSISSENCYHENGSIIFLQFFGRGKFVGTNASFHQSEENVKRIIKENNYEFFNCIFEKHEFDDNGLCKIKGCQETNDEKHKHEFDEWKTIKTSTSTSCGGKTRKCKTCGYIEYDNTILENHHLIYKDKLEPTCTIDGHNAYFVCEVCEYTNYELIPSLGHKFVDINNVVEKATCTSTGTKEVLYCTTCGHVETEIIPSLGHNFVNFLEYDENEHKFECSRCKDEVVSSHKLIYEMIDDERHTKYCQDCEYKTSEYHIYMTNICECGFNNNGFVHVKGVVTYENEENHYDDNNELIGDRFINNYSNYGSDLFHMFTITYTIPEKISLDKIVYCEPIDDFSFIIDYYGRYKPTAYGFTYKIINNSSVNYTKIYGRSESVILSSLKSGVGMTCEDNSLHFKSYDREVTISKPPILDNDLFKDYFNWVNETLRYLSTNMYGGPFDSLNREFMKYYLDLYSKTDRLSLTNYRNTICYNKMTLSDDEFSKMLTTGTRTLSIDEINSTIYYHQEDNIIYQIMEYMCRNGFGYKFIKNTRDEWKNVYELISGENYSSGAFDTSLNEFMNPFLCTSNVLLSYNKNINIFSGSVIAGFYNFNRQAVPISRFDDFLRISFMLSPEKTSIA